MTPESKMKCRWILENSNPYDQIEQFIEECSEAILAMQKFKRALAKAGKEEDVVMCSTLKKEWYDVITEIADVQIMSEQMKHNFGDEAVDKETTYKIERQIRRIKNGEKA